MSLESWRRVDLMRKAKGKNLLGYEIKIIPDEESGYFAARFPDFPGIVTGGYTPEEAIQNAREALELTIDTIKKNRLPLPIPKLRYSGQFNVRVPRGLHRELVTKAEEEGVSLNALLTYLLSQSINLEKNACASTD
jgi:predicted RNase H-like HicB family nuclease